jgi:uncharacterized protein
MSHTEAPRRRRVLITGASAGIGAAFARLFARRGFDLVLTARRDQRLQAVADECRTRWHADVHVMPADLALPDSPRRLHEQLRAADIPIDALVNNAGYGLPGQFLASPWTRHAEFLQVMVTAVAELTHRFLPAMVERGYGRIVNVASLAGLVPATAGHTLYAPSKALLIKFSQSLALEVRPRGVYVTALCPGFTYSEFHDVSATRDIVARLPRWMWMDADAVAEQGFEAVMAGRPICVTGRVNRTIAWLTRHLPDRVMSWATQRQSRKYRRS